MGRSQYSANARALFPAPYLIYHFEVLLSKLAEGGIASQPLLYLRYFSWGQCTLVITIQQFDFFN
jgi:hypothetical protein